MPREVRRSAHWSRPKVGLEAPRLFDVEAPELATFDVFLEAFDRARGGVDRCIVAPLGVFQIDDTKGSAG
jgi:hypothetical protein